MTDVKPGVLKIARSLVSRSSIAVGLAFSLSLLSTWLMNVTVYPGFNDFAPWTRDVATAVGGAAGVGSALYARWRPYGFLGRNGLALALAMLMLGPALMLASTVWASPALAVVGSNVRSAAGVFVGIYTGFALMRLSGSERAGALALAYGVYYLWMGLLEPLAYGGGASIVLDVLFWVVPLVALCLLYARAVPELRSAALVGTQADLSPTNPAPFLLLNHRLYVVVILFQAAMGYATTFGSTQSFPQSFLPVLGVTIMLLAMLLLRGLRPIDSLYTLAFACTLAGFLLIPGAVAGVGDLVQTACNSLCRAGEGLFRIALWLAVVSIGARNPVGALPLILMVNGVGGFGFELGAITGHVTNYVGETRPELVFVVVAAIVFGFVMCNFVLARSFSFDATVAGVEPVHPVRELADDVAACDYDAVCAHIAAEHGLTAREAEVLPLLARGRNVAYIMEELTLSRNTIKSYDAVCAHIAAEHGLTAREAEVLPLLARGRNVAYIMEELTLSRNTIKSYVARVYGKLDVHSHQELIDMVERAAGE